MSLSLVVRSSILRKPESRLSRQKEAVQTVQIYSTQNIEIIKLMHCLPTRFGAARKLTTKCHIRLKARLKKLGSVVC